MALYLPAEPAGRGRLLANQFVEETRLVNLGMVVLVFDVATDDEFVDADGGNKVTSCPE